MAMMRVTAQIDGVSMRLETDDQLHPEFYEMMLTRVSIHAAILYTKKLSEQIQQGMTVLD